MRSIRSVGRASYEPSFFTSAALVGVLVVGAIAGIAVQHHTPGRPSSASPDPPTASYPGSAVFDHQPAAPWWRHVTS